MSFLFFKQKTAYEVRISDWSSDVCSSDLHAALLDRGDELAARSERKVVPAPQAEPLRIGEVLHRRRPCRGDIDDARVGKRVLKSQSRSPLLRRFLVAALALSTRRIGHRMGLLENDPAVDVRPEPFGYLLDPSRLATAAPRRQRRLRGAKAAF